MPLIALHKKSNISNFAIKSNFEEEPLPMQDLLYHDIVVIQHSELLSLALARPRTMTPAMNNIDTRSNRFSLFELLPVEPSLDPHIKMGESVYLRNKESALYLSAESQRLNSFANVCSPPCSCLSRRSSTRGPCFRLRAQLARMDR